MRIPGSPASSGRRAGTTARPALHDALVRNRFVPGETESIMIGDAALLAADVPLPKGVHSGGSRARPDVRATQRDAGRGLRRRVRTRDGRCAAPKAGLRGWDGALGGRGRRRDRQLRPPGAGTRDGVRRASGAAPHDRNGVGAESTGRSRRPGHDRRSGLARGSSTATRLKSRARSSNERDSSRSRRRRPTCGWPAGRRCSAGRACCIACASVRECPPGPCRASFRAR